MFCGISISYVINGNKKRCRRWYTMYTCIKCEKFIVFHISINSKYIKILKILIIILLSIGFILVTWPHLTTWGAGKCRLSGQPWIHLLIIEKKKSRIHFYGHPAVSSLAFKKISYVHAAQRVQIPWFLPKFLKQLFFFGLIFEWRLLLEPLNNANCLNFSLVLFLSLNYS